MEKLSANSTHSEVRFSVDHLRIQLRAHPDTQALANEMDTVAEALRQETHTLKVAKDTRKTSMAEVDLRDDQMDRGLLELGSAAYTASGLKRDRGLYKALFPRLPPSDVGGLPEENQRAEVSLILDELARPEMAGLASHAEPLRFSYEEHGRALQRKSIAVEAEARARRERDRASEAARRAYNGSYLKLLLIFGEEQRTLVESFFPQGASKKSRKKKNASQSGPQPSGSEAGASLQSPA